MVNKLKVFGDESRPDRRGRRVWRNGQNAYFDVRVTNTNSRSQANTAVKNILKKHENEKKHQYNKIIVNIEVVPLRHTVCFMFTRPVQN